MKRTFFDPELAELAELAERLDATMALGADTVVVNGQRFTTPTWASYAPTGFGPQTSGVPNVSPSAPPFIGSGGSGPGASGGLEGVGGYGTAGNNALAAGAANANPWNLRVSPVLWAVFGLLLALFLLRHVTFRDTILEGADERASAGPFTESGSEAVS